MILWVVLFILVVAISFVLAAQSMRDYSEIPDKEGDYSLFLIRNTQGLDTLVLSSIKNELSESKVVIAFERLFKGNKSALVIFGPRNLVLNHKSSLDLLELEDYTNVPVEQVSAWEVGIKKNTEAKERLFANMPNLVEHEQFWWQVVLSSQFKPQITAIVVSPDSERKHSLAQTLHHLASQAHKLPKAFSDTQLLDFYQKRSFRKDTKNPHLSEEEILQLLLMQGG